MLFKRFFIWSSGRLAFSGAKSILCILVEGFMGKFIGCYFKFGHMIREKMIFKDISYLELLSPFCSAERKICTILVHQTS